VVGTDGTVLSVDNHVSTSLQPCLRQTVHTAATTTTVTTDHTSRHSPLPVLHDCSSSESCLQLPTSAGNVALPAFAVAAPVAQRSINISYPPCPQQQTRRTLLQWDNGGDKQMDRETDTAPLHRPCSTYSVCVASRLHKEVTAYLIAHQQIVVLKYCYRMS